MLETNSLVSLLEAHIRGQLPPLEAEGDPDPELFVRDTAWRLEAELQRQVRLYLAAKIMPVPASYNQLAGIRLMNLDAKNRLRIPTAFRDNFSDTAVVVPGPGASTLLLHPRDWEPASRPRCSELQVSGAYEVSVRRMHRIVLDGPTRQRMALIAPAEVALIPTPVGLMILKNTLWNARCKSGVFPELAAVQRMRAPIDTERGG